MPLSPDNSSAPMPEASLALSRYRQLAGYNRWANARVFAAAQALGPDLCAKPMGAFFGSILATLNHLVVTDRIWLARFMRTGAPQPALDTLLETDLARLLPLRQAEDERLAGFIARLTADDLAAPLTYANSTGQTFSQSYASALDHLFNHQTHHRGQVHALLTQLGGHAAAPSLDLVAFQRDA